MRFDNNKRDYTDEIRRTNFHRWNFPPRLHFLDDLIYIIALGFTGFLKVAMGKFS